MSKDEMREILSRQLAKFRGWTYAQLAERVEQDRRTRECLDSSDGVAADGTAYFIEFNAYTTIESSFAGWEYLRITGSAFQTFGWDAYPADLVQSALSAFQRMVADRDGRGLFPTETDPMRFPHPATQAYYPGLAFAMLA